MILEGTSQHTVASAQALAITELLAHAATSLHTEPRAILLACDDYSAVSGKVPLWQLYERGRSLGHRRPGVRPVLARPRAPPTMTGAGSRPPPTAASG